MDHNDSLCQKIMHSCTTRMKKEMYFILFIKLDEYFPTVRDFTKKKSEAIKKKKDQR